MSYFFDKLVRRSWTSRLEVASRETPRRLLNYILTLVTGTDNSATITKVSIRAFMNGPTEKNNTNHQISVVLLLELDTLMKDAMVLVDKDGSLK